MDPNGGVFPIIIIIIMKKTLRNKMTKFIHKKPGRYIVKELYSKQFQSRLDVWQITHQFNFKLFNIFSHNYTVNKKLKYLRFKIVLFFYIFIQSIFSPGHYHSLSSPLYRHVNWKLKNHAHSFTATHTMLRTSQ